ncbi:MAG: caspase domain-containing protein [Isosphaeraceae bacterium]
MAARSVLVSIVLLAIFPCYGCSGGQGTEGQPPTTQARDSGAKTNPRPTGKAEKLALLVGIDKYKAVNGLSGCVADARNMQGLLQGKFDFPEDSIKILADEQATHAAIIQAFKDHLIRRAEESTVVVFHYSGHGSRMKDPSGKSPSGEISTIVPHDSRTEGVYDINADELRGLFSLLAEKTKNVTFIFDSCHSGMALKDVATARARVVAADPRDPPPLPPEARLAPRGVGEASEGLKSRNYALLSACQANEIAFGVHRPEWQSLRHADALLRCRGARLGQGRYHLSRRYGQGQGQGHGCTALAAPPARGCED